MKKMKSIACCIGFTTIVGLTGCAGSSVQQIDNKNRTDVKLSWWGNDVRHEYTMDGVDQFEVLHPDISVSLEYSDSNSYKLRNSVQMASATEPDVMLINSSWLPIYTSDGEGYYDLSSLSEQLDLTQFTDSDLLYGTMNGKLNAIPTALTAKIFMYNTKLYEDYGMSLPTTWADLDQAAKKMNPDGVYPILLDGNNLPYVLVAYAEQLSGKTFIDSEGSLKFTAKECEQMIQGYLDLVDHGVTQFYHDIGLTDIEGGKFAGAVNWVTKISEYQGKFEAAGGTIGIGPLVTRSNAKRNGYYAKPATMYAISANSKNPSQAAILLDYLLNSEEMAKLQGCEKGIPVSQNQIAVLQENDLIDADQYEAIQMVNESGVNIMSPYLEDSTVLNAILKAVDEVYYKVSDSQTASKKLYTDLKQYLSK